MKSYQYLFIISIFLISCTGNNNKSDAYGNFEATEVTVSALGQGQILRFDVEEGSILHEDQVVGLIDTIDLHLKEEQLVRTKAAIATRIPSINSQIDVQKQQEANLLVDKERIDNLYKDGAATKKQLDDVNGALDLINSQIKSLEVQRAAVYNEMETIDTQVAQIQESIRKCHIRNPLNGTVLVKFAENGEIAAFGKPLYKIADLENIKLKVYVSGAQLPHIKLGQMVEVLVDEDETSNRTLNGTVSWISQSAEFTPKTIQTKEER
ncbi:MAG: efflux RND transporter periplasmic adaptor subunit, partial [Bacteroidota bacterium]|nr:efflux RND transporter periplasmic adaptor subunit [Bacteroidota bacterium]